jgi:predicted permease
VSDENASLWIRVLSRLLPTTYREEILGDLLEERRAMINAGSSRAVGFLWVMSHLLRSAVVSRRRRYRRPDSRAMRVESVESAQGRGMGRREPGGYIWFPVFALEARQALRACSRAPAVPIAMLITIALSVCTSSAVAMAARFLVFAPLPLPRSQELVRIFVNQPGVDTSAVALPDLESWRAYAHEFEAIGAYTPAPGTIQLVEGAVPLAGLWVTSELVRTLGVHLTLGTAGAPASDGGHSLLLTQHGWHQLFAASPDVIGRVVLVNGAETTIVGVLDDLGFELPDAGRAVDAWIPIPHSLAPWQTARDSFWLYAIGRIRPGGEERRASEDLTLVAAALAKASPSSNGHRTVRLQSLQQDVVGTSKSVLVPVMLVIGLGYVIACVNLALLITARSGSWSRYTFTLVAVGCSRLQVARRALIEIGAPIMGGAAVGALMAPAALRALLGLYPGRLPRTISGVSVWDGATFSAVVALSFLVVGCGVALALSWRLSRSVSRDMQRSVRILDGPHRWLVGAQFATALFLLTIALTCGWTTIRLVRTDPGIESRGRIAINLQFRSSAPAGNSRRVVDEILSRGARRSEWIVAAANTVPTQATWVSSDARFPGQPAPAPGSALSRVVVNVVSTTYPTAIGLRLKGGRTFLERDSQNAEPVALINERLQREAFGGGSGIGQRFAFHDKTWLVVGLVGDVRQYGMATAAPPALYFLSAQMPQTPSWIIAAGSDESSLASEIRRTIREVDPTVSIATTARIDDMLSDTTAPDRFRAVLSVSVGLVSLVASLVGTYGLTTFAVGMRRRESALRLALGASSRVIRWTIVREALAVASYGSVVGVIGTMVAVRWLVSVVAGLTSPSGIVLALTITILLAAAFCGAWLPAVRAGREDLRSVLQGW